jgi:hypothetical protein
LEYEFVLIPDLHIVPLTRFLGLQLQKVLTHLKDPNAPLAAIDPAEDLNKVDEKVAILAILKLTPDSGQGSQF